MNSATKDVLFKLVFGDERNKKMLIHLLNCIINSKNNPIDCVDIRKSELTPECVGGKGVRLDIVAKASDGRIINIEIQKQCDVNMRERSLFYWSELFFQQLEKGGKYNELHQTICINILEENLFDDERFWHTYHMTEDETHEPLTDMEEIHFLEIVKMHEFKKDSPITWWLEFLKNPHSEVVKKIGEFEPIIKEAVKMFDIVSADPRTRELIRMREKGERDFNSAVANAEERGRNEGMKEAAQKMLLAGIDSSIIASSLGLSPSEIQSLRQH